MSTQHKPKVVLGDRTRPEGNVFSIITRCRKAAEEAGWTTTQWRTFLNDLVRETSYDRIVERIGESFELDSSPEKVDAPI